MEPRRTPPHRLPHLARLPAVQPPTPPAPRPVVRPKPPPPPFDRTITVVHRCNHPGTFGVWEPEAKRDRYRAARRAKAEGRDCPACRAARVKAEQETAAARRKAGPKKLRKPRPNRFVRSEVKRGRLPDGSQFSTLYIAAEERWTGTLTVPGVGTYEGSASGVHTLLLQLDDAYRVAVWTAGEGPEAAQDQRSTSSTTADPPPPPPAGGKAP